MIINQDTYITKKKCLSIVKKSIIDGYDVIVDNTNPSDKIRKVYRDLAQEYNIRIITYLFDYPKELCMYLNYHRSQCGGRYVPNIAYNIYYKQYERPQGDNVINIPYISNKSFVAQYVDKN